MPITYEWYRDFINTLLAGHHETWFAWVITLGEIAIGVGLILGILTGIAAFFGAFMNMSFLLAGSASTNPILFTLAVGLMLAWKVAGYYGVDRYLLLGLWGMESSFGDVVINPKKVLATISFDALQNEVGQAFVVIERKSAKGQAGSVPAARKSRGGSMPEAGSARLLAWLNS